MPPPTRRRRSFREVAVAKPVTYGPSQAPLVGVLDCGIKVSILRNLLDRELAVVRVSRTTTRSRPAGRAGRSAASSSATARATRTSWPPTIESLRPSAIDGRPTLGICLGHQLVALARGATTYKLKFGHRGQNKTVCFPDGRSYIVSENHGYAVDAASLAGTDLAPWATNPDDGTLEGLRDRRGRVLALQGHPEGHPGPQEAGFVFDRFAELVRKEPA